MRIKNSLLVILLLYQPGPLYSVAIVQVPYGGRFGDQLMHYIRIKWLAKKYKANFFHIPFERSNQLVLERMEPHFDSQKFKHSKKHVLMNEAIIRNNKCSDMLFEHDYRCDYFTTWYLKPAPWCEIVKDVAFVHHIKEMIRPVHEIPQLPIPKNHISVAVHIRTGGGFDIACCSEQEFHFSAAVSEKPCVKVRDHYADYIWPLKFVPMQFYIDQIKRLSELLLDVPLYVYIFTDDQQPGKICKRLQEKVGKTNIIYDCRQQGNHHSRNVVEDMFAMAYQFDCLIRGGSHIPFIADFIGNHKIVIRPVEAFWYGNKLVVTKVDLVAKDKSFVACFGIENQCTDGFNSWILT